MNEYRLVSGFERMRSDDIALDAMEPKSERVVLDPSDFVCYGLRCLHFPYRSDLSSSSSPLLVRVILQKLCAQAIESRGVKYRKRQRLVCGVLMI